jgi:hypothetical protein
MGLGGRAAPCNRQNNPPAIIADGLCSQPKFELRRAVAAWRPSRIKELIENLPDLALLVERLLVVRRVLREQISIVGCWREPRT